MRRRLLTVAALAVGALALATPRAEAHPLGNFTINAYAGLHLTPSTVGVDYVLDLAEIPTYQQRDDFTRRGPAGSCQRFADGLQLSTDGHRAHLAVRASALSFPPGQGGAATLRLECSLTAPARPGTLTFSDPWFAGRLGWHEITVVPDRVTVQGAHPPAASVSDRLTRYPQDLLRSPLHVRSTSFTVENGGAAAATSLVARLPGQALPGPVAKATSTLVGLATRHQLTVSFALVALVVAVALGATHALAPGHGKTVMAAAMVGRHGSLRQAMVIAGTVTATHTSGVLLIGVALSLSTAWAPEQLYPFLTLTSGVLVVSLGASLLRGAARSRRNAGLADHAHEHAHAHGLEHEQGHGHEHGHEHPHPHQHLPGQVDEHGTTLGTRRLVTLGFAGGLVPSPSALVVLLAAIALGRAWFGVLLVVAYGAGMALTLTTTGLLLARTSSLLRRRQALRHLSALPVVGAVAVITAGSLVALRGLAGVA